MFGKSRLIVMGTLSLGLLLFGVVASAQDGNGNGPRNRFRYQGGGVQIVDPENGIEWQRGQRAPQGMMGMYAVLPPATSGELPQEVIDAMILGLQDERNAIATYEAVIETFGEVRPFVNILRAEQQHEAAWLFMFDRYGVDIPADVAPTIPTFTTAVDACAAARQVEIDNAGLYDEMLATFAPYPDLTQVTTALRNASLYNHLPAFERCAG